MFIGFPVTGDRLTVWRHTEDGDLIVVDPQIRDREGLFLRFYSETRDDERGILRRSARQILEPLPQHSDEHRRACAAYTRFQARRGPVSAADALASVAGQQPGMEPALALAMLPAFDIHLAFDMDQPDDPVASRVRADAWTVAGSAPECLIGQRDMELVMHWLDDDWRRRSAEREAQAKRTAGKEGDHLARLLSARVAEKALAGFLTKAGRTVVDVSIQQLGGAPDGDWTQYDLLVDGTGIDVKSARRVRPRSAAVPSQRYVSHSVARFKHMRHGPDARIAGVLSSHVHPVALGDYAELARRDTWPMFLGETAETRIDSLRDRFTHQAFEGVDALRSTGRAAYLLPPWIFEYPAWLYHSRDQALAAVAERLRQDGWDGVRTGHVPVSIATGVPLPPAARNRLPPWQRALYDTLLAGTQQAGGPSLPFVFLGLMEHFVGVLDGSVRVPPEFAPQQYAELVFYRPAREMNPIGLYDPLQTAATLISSLARLWTGFGQGPRWKFRQLRVSGGGILRGRASSNERWRTLLAYCGDCGNDPLIYGEDPWCPACLCLQCRACGACSLDCTAARGERRGAAT